MKPSLLNSAAPAAALLILLIHLSAPVSGVFIGSAFALIGLMILGIPHGSLDHIITERTSASGSGQSFSLIRFLIVYLLTMGVYALFWVWLPVFSLGFFLLMSAWHFGETDFENNRLGQHWAAKAGFMLYGCLLLFGLLANDAAQTREILVSLLGPSAVLDGFVRIVDQYPLLRYTEFFALGFRALMLPSAKAFDHLRLFVILAVAFFLPLLEGFLLYFCHHHAWVNLLRMKERIYGEGSEGLYSMIKDMMPFSAISVIGIIILVASSPLWLSHVNPVLLFFILISVLTLPHAGIMSKFYSKPTIAGAEA